MFSSYNVEEDEDDPLCDSLMRTNFIPICLARLPPVPSPAQPTSSCTHQIIIRLTSQPFYS